MSYSEKLRAPQWLAVRKRVLARDTKNQWKTYNLLPLAADQP